MKFFTTALIASVFFTSQSFAYNSKASNSEASNQTISELAQNTPELSTLVTALKTADLVETLSQEGTFTVFAPTNEAFEALPEGALEKLLNDKEELKKVLLTHVLDQTVKAKKVTTLNEANAINGKELAIATVGGKVYVSGTQVQKADIEASNGVIHLIDGVILPADLNLDGQS